MTERGQHVDEAATLYGTVPQFFLHASRLTEFPAPYIGCQRLPEDLCLLVEQFDLAAKLHPENLGLAAVSVQVTTAWSWLGCRLTRLRYPALHLQCGR